MQSPGETSAGAAGAQPSGGSLRGLPSAISPYSRRSRPTGMRSPMPGTSSAPALFFAARRSEMHESPETTARLQRIMDRSIRTAGPRMKDSFGSPDWRMTVQEFLDFWGNERMASIATASTTGLVHSAALDIRL